MVDNSLSEKISVTILQIVYMQIFDLLTNPQIKNLVLQQNEVDTRKADAGYNLFTISSYNSYFENFHSDIIASLLDTNGLHNEKNSFLLLFIDYLNKVFHTSIDSGNYLNTSVKREKGRLDIWIFDEYSKHSIIIENKINNAVDRDNQIDDYHDYVLRNNYIIDAIVYLSKDGHKVAPINNEEINRLVVNVPAFNNTASDLYMGWLKASQNICTNKDSESFIHQYAKLISHLSNKNMESNIKKEFYDFVNQHKALDAVLLIENLHTFQADYRAELFAKELKSHAPFKTKFLCYNNFWVFDDFTYLDEKFKMDVFFMLDGSASIVICNKNKSNQDGYNAAKHFVSILGLLDQFNAPSRSDGMHCKFSIGEEFQTMAEIDKAILTLVKIILEKLKLLKAS